MYKWTSKESMGDVFEILDPIVVRRRHFNLFSDSGSSHGLCCNAFFVFMFQSNAGAPTVCNLWS